MSYQGVQLPAPCREPNALDPMLNLPPLCVAMAPAGMLADAALNSSPPCPWEDGWMGCQLQRLELTLRKSPPAFVVQRSRSPLCSPGVPWVSKAAFTPKKQETQRRAKSSGQQMCACLQPPSRASLPPPRSGTAYFNVGSHGSPTAPTSSA